MTFELNKIHNVDARVLLGGMESESVDWLVTDPPYPNGLGLFEEDWQAAYDVLRDGCRVAKQGISFVWGPFDVPTPPIGWYHVSTHVWEKPNGRSSRWFENIHTWQKTPEKRGCYVWRIPIINYETLPEWTPHPTQKPLKLMGRWLKWLGDGSILDPYAGSGTTLLMAEKMNRRWIASEKNPEFCQIANERIERWRAQGVLDFGTDTIKKANCA